MLKRLKNCAWKIVVMLLFVSLGMTACGTEKENDSVSNNVEEMGIKELQVGDVAPEFTAKLVDGSTFILKEKEGKVILLNFWATWCGPCVGEMPAFQDLYEEYGEKIEILAVNCMEDKQTIDRFVEETGYQFPIAYDVEGKICITYPSSGIPYTLVIGKDGTVKKIYVGAADAQTQYRIYKAAIDEELMK